jgi:hypothetical protein
MKYKLSLSIPHRQDSLSLGEGWGEVAKAPSPWERAGGEVLAASGIALLFLFNKHKPSRKTIPLLLIIA